MKLPLLAFLFLLVTPRAQAVLVSSRDLESALASVDLIADIEVISRQTVPDPRVITRHLALVRVIDVLESHTPAMPTEGETALVETAGGEFQELGVFYGGMPHLYFGKRYRAHLKRSSGSAFRIVGMGSGLKPLGPSRSSTRNRTDGSNGEGDGAFLHWDDNYLPIPYYLSLPSFRNLPFFADAIDASFKTWRDVADIKIEFVAQGCTNSLRNENDGVNTIILITDEWPYDSSAIAITRNFYIANDGPRSGMILDTDILLNGVHQSFTATGEAGKYDVQDILTHEIGHLLGLGHEKEPEDTEAVMYARAEVGETKKRHLSSNDLLAIRSAYPGVGIKSPSGPTAASCSISDHTPSCVAVHGPEGSAPSKGMVAFFLVLLFVPLFVRSQFLRQISLSKNVK